MEAFTFETYGIIADLLTTYRPSPDLIKALWVVCPFAAATGIAALFACRPTLPIATAKYQPLDETPLMVLYPQNDGGFLAYRAKPNPESLLKRRRADTPTSAW